MPSGMEWDSAHRNVVTRENQVYRKSLEVLAGAPRAPVRAAERKVTLLYSKSRKLKCV